MGWDIGCDTRWGGMGWAGMGWDGVGLDWIWMARVELLRWSGAGCEGWGKLR